MKVLYLVSWYKRPGSPNSGYFFYQLAKGISEYAEEVVVLNIHVKFFAVIDKVGITKKQEGNLYEYTFFLPSLIPRCKRLYDRIGRIGSAIMLRIIKKEHGSFDIVHVQSALMAASFSEPFLRRLSIPIIYTEHSSRILNDNLNYLEQNAINTMNEKANECFAVSNALAQKLSNYVSDVRVIGNIIDFDEQQEIFELEKSEKFTFVCIATLRKDKGIVELINAFANEFDKNESVRLLIAGSGEYRDEIIKEKGKYIDHDILMLGEVPHNKIKSLLQACDCFVLPSKYETFGIVYVEAMACGLPVIATKCGGPEEFVNDKNGILVEVNNQEQLMTAMRRIKTNYGKYDKEFISSQAIEKYGKNSICKTYFNIYRKAII